MQIALEKDLRQNLQKLAAQSDRSMKDWILDNILSIHRSTGIDAFLTTHFGAPIVIAQPTNADRFNILIKDQVILDALEDASRRLQRTKPQIVYTLLTKVIDEKMGVAVKTPHRAKSA